MPIYEYQCQKCQAVSEFLVGVVQKKVEIKCKHCGSKKLKKIFSGSFISTPGKMKDMPCADVCPGRNQGRGLPPCAQSGICNQ